MTNASGWRAETSRAFSTASTCAQVIADEPAPRDARLIRSSSIAAGWIVNGTPAASSRRARAVLAEARMIGSAIAAMAPDPQLVDRRGSLLDRAAGDVDDRPMLLGEDSPCLADLGPHCLDISIIGAFVMVEHAEPVAAQMDQPLGIVGEPDDQWLLRAEHLGRQRHARDKGHI